MLPVLQKILVGFDGSQNSVEACEFAAILAKGYKSNITIAHVLPPITILTAARRAQYEASIANKADLEAMKMESRLGKEGIAAKSRIIRGKGSIADSLIDLSEKEKIDLIVAGTRGLGAFRRMLVGSVSTKLLNQAPCSVLVVRKRIYKIQMQLDRILVATDGSKSASKAVEYAVSIAKKVGADLTAVYVVYMPPLAYGGWVPMMDQILRDLKKDGERALSEANTLARANDVKVRTKLIENNGSPGWEITKFSDEGKFDLVVVGTRGLGGLEKAILGSVANSVVHYTKCSVLVTR